MPCLNEARTLGPCIAEAFEALRSLDLPGEVIVADNGSTDGSVALAHKAGARVVPVPDRGYGAALRAGLVAARGRWLVMGDSDQSYDFRDAARLLAPLRDGTAQLVMGNRFAPGMIAAGAMPWKNRYVGNPALSGLGRLLFRVPVRDFHCGLRAFTREAFDRIHPVSPGMEFASELVARAALLGLPIAEVPVHLRKDGRDRPPHLRPWRDGWRHLKFMLALSPRWTLFAPAALALVLGAVLIALTMGGTRLVAGVGLGIHTMVAGCLLVLVGWQWLCAACLMRAYALRGVLRECASVRAVRRLVSPERALLAGGAMLVVGLVPWGALFVHWIGAGLGDLNPAQTLPPVVLGTTLAAMGAQTILAGAMLAMFEVGRPDGAERGS